MSGSRRTAVATLILGAAVATAAAQAAPIPSANILDRRGSPTAMRDTGAAGHQRFSPMFDLGSWHGYLLPLDSSGYGAFPGPMIVAEEYAVYLANALERLTLVDEDGRTRDWSRAENLFWSGPGVLNQRFAFPDVVVSLSLRMASARTAVIVTTLRDASGKAKRYRLRWNGGLLDKWDRAGRTVAAVYPQWQRDVRATPDGVEIVLGPVRDPMALMISAGAGLHIRRSVKTATRITGGRYESESAPLRLEASATLVVLTTESYVLGAGEWEREAPRTASWLATPAAGAAAIASAGDKRWAGYLSRAWRGVPPDVLSRRLAQKSVETLIGNWRSAAGALRHDAVVPSTEARWFNGLWAWDSWKHAAALAHVDPALARSSVEAMFDYQITARDKVRPLDAGMIPDAVFFNKDAARGGDGQNWNERDSKPPLATWAVWTIHRADPRADWLARMYPKLVAYHEWWWWRRDHDHDGLAEYGATVHPAHANAAGAIARARVVEAASWESGMDDAARFGGLDSARLAAYAAARCRGDIACARRDWTPAIWENRDDRGVLAGYSLAQESVDLNAYLAVEEAGLARIAAALGKKDEAARWTTRARLLGARVRDCFWDGGSRFFYDRDLSGTAMGANGCRGAPLTRRGRGAEAWAVLWSGWATPAQVRALGDAMEDSTAFGGGLPLPTAARDNPGFGPTIYWRGRVWVDQLFFALDGLRRAGDSARADRLWQRFVERAGGLTSGEPLNENYDPDGGAPLGAPNFSWTAAHILLWLEGEGAAPRTEPPHDE